MQGHQLAGNRMFCCGFHTSLAHKQMVVKGQKNSFTRVCTHIHAFQYTYLFTFMLVNQKQVNRNGVIEGEDQLCNRC